MDNKRNLKELRLTILLSIYLFFIIIFLSFDNPLSYYFYSTIERFAAKYEAETGNVHFIHKAVYGNCRIVNLNEVIKNPDFCVVMGELFHKGKKYYHLWATKDCNNPILVKNIVDKTKRNFQEIKEDFYIPRIVIKLSTDCKAYTLWSLLDTLDNRERIIYKKFFAYIETFCKVKMYP